MVLDLRLQHTRGLQVISKLMMSHHGRGRKPCPLCEENDLNLSVLEHVFDAHGDRIRFNGSAEQALHQLVGETYSLLIVFGTCLYFSFFLCTCVVW